MDKNVYFYIIFKTLQNQRNFVSQGCKIIFTDAQKKEG